MAEKQKGAVHISHLPEPEVKHTIKSATLLYSAPGFILRGPIYIIFLIAITALIYSIFATKDELVASQMEVVADETVVQAPASGYIRQVNVADGSRISSNTELVTIQTRIRAGQESSDAESLEMGRDDIESELLRSKEELEKDAQDIRARIDELLTRMDAAEKVHDQQVKIYDDKIKASVERVPIVKLEKSKTEEALKAKQREIDHLKDQLKTLRSQFEKDQGLYKKGLITEPQFLQSQTAVKNAEKAVLDAQGQLRQLQETLKQKELEVEQAKNQPDRLRKEKTNQEQSFKVSQLALSERQAEYKRQLENLHARGVNIDERFSKKLDRIDEKLRGARNLMPGVRFEGGYCKIEALRPGTVTKVYAEMGQQVAMGQPLFRYVARSKQLYGRLLVSNAQIGKLEIDQEVKIKFAAYPYQEYGIQSGTVKSIATTTSEMPGEEGMYVVEVALHEQHINVPGKKKAGPKLHLGLLATAEIVTGKKRLIEIIFRPVSKFFQQEE